MNTQHTPGPWTVGHMGKRVIADVKHLGGHGAMQSTVAECAREEDARLIAAAPELLEALQLALQLLRANVDLQTLGESHRFDLTDWNAARSIFAAISKATGERQ